jgi:hypothetical protein
MFKKVIFVFTIITIGCFFIPVQANEQRFIITEAGGRAFLLDTHEGAVWRYFFNKVDDQGWQRTEFPILETEEREYYKTKPYGETDFILKKIKDV